MSPTLSRRGLMAGLAATATATAAATATIAPLVRAPSARAATPAGTAPRVVSYTRRVGEAEVTVLLDGYFLLEQAWVTALPAADLLATMEAAALDTAAAIPLPITAYVIRQGDTVTLMDGGAGASLGPTAGHLAATLAATGTDPAAVTRIVVSHLHPDHVGGLVADGAAVFPRATLHVSAPERAYWSDAAIAGAAPDAVKPWFALAQAVLGAYGDRVMPFEGDADLGAGLSAVALPGHTPGHTGYRVSSGDADLLLWGDSTALAPMQFTHPDSGIVFDTDSAVAAATRRRVFDMAAADRLLVAGTHMPFPGFGHVARRGDTYAWEPEQWKLF